MPPHLRVVQWDTGTIGTRALRAVVEHPDLTPAGVYVHGQDKIGLPQFRATWPGADAQT